MSSKNFYASLLGNEVLRIARNTTTWKTLGHDALKKNRNVKIRRHEKRESNNVFVKYMDVISI